MADEEEANASKIDEVVDCKTQSNGSLMYRVRWVSYSWVPEQYLASSANLIQSFWSKRHGTSRGASGTKKRKSCSEIADEDASHQFGKAIDGLTSRVDDIQQKLDAEVKNRGDLVQILSKLLLSVETQEIQTRHNTEGITNLKSTVHQLNI